MIGENKYSSYKPTSNALGNFRSIRNSQRPSFDKSAKNFTNDFKFGQFAKQQVMSPQLDSKFKHYQQIQSQNRNESQTDINASRFSAKTSINFNKQNNPIDLKIISGNDSLDYLKPGEFGKSLNPNESIGDVQRYMPKCWISKNDSITKSPVNQLVTPLKENTDTFQSSKISMEHPSSMLGDKDIRVGGNRYINHKTGKQVDRPFSGIKRVGSIENYTQLENKKLNNYTNSKINFGPEFNNGQITWDFKNNRSKDFVNYSKDATFLSLKSNKVTNNSVQKYMKNLQKVNDQRSRQYSIHSKTSNYDRRDQSPQPNYPNFEPKKQGNETSGERLAKPKVGEIGWGVDDPHLQYSPRIGDQIDKNHVNHWNHKETQKFNSLTGNFTKMHDKQLDINSEIYHLMNASAQRISIKSLDMQRQSFINSNRKGSGSISPKGMNMPIQKGQQQTFPEVVSILNNPFQKQPLNFAVKHQQAIVTPRMANEMRGTKQFNVEKRSHKNSRTKSYGLK